MLPTNTIRCHEFSRLSEGRLLLDRIEEQLRSYDTCERSTRGIVLALEEALANAVKHGNRLDASKSVRFTYQITSERFEAHIEDEGEGFDPDDLPDPADPENLERCCGRGVFLIRFYMTHVEYNERGNAVHMFKTRQRGTPPTHGDTISDVTM